MKVLLFLLLPFISLANVDMVMGDTAENELIISWSLEDTVFAGKYVGGEFTQVVVKPGLNTGIVTIAKDSEDGKHVLFLPYGYTFEPLYVEMYSYSYDDLACESVTSVLMQTNDTFRFLKSADDRWDAVLAHSYVLCTGSWSALLCVSQISWGVWTGGSLFELNEATWEKLYSYSDLRSGDDAGLTAGPVVCPGGYPLFAVSFGLFSSSSEWVEHNYLMFDPDSADLLHSSILEGWDPDIAGVLGLGSSSDTDAVLIYSDDSGNVNWSTFGAFSPVPESTDILPWDFPESGDPLVFTSTYELPGMLMVWYKDGEIRCRHWNGEWNNYDYFVASSSYPTDTGEIAVCSNTDGYWIAWLPGTASEPEVVFISFDEVTGVESNESQPFETSIRINPVTNPVTGILCVEVSGISSGIAVVTDLSGRTVFESEILGEGIHSLGGLPVSGMYLVRLHHSTGIVSCRVVSF